ncbi:MAG: acetolactate decarboxylase [Ignavibacteriaceae bacterium]|jgi:acetolactate decarboxylase|nr:acetolactate decarboxylase [Ignavibacteriaceae bacterium]
MKNQLTKILFYVFIISTLALPQKKETNVLYQYSVINALSAGVYEGDLTVNELKKYGDFGLGTFNNIDGEMVVLDGKIYQIKTDGIPVEAAKNLISPFAAVTFFKSDTNIEINHPQTLQQIKEKIDAAVPSENYLYAVKISGEFKKIKTRSVPKQQKPFPDLASVIKNQITFEKERVSGTVMGFKMPEFIDGVNVKNFHFHFLSKDKNFGGHLLDFVIEKGKIEIGIIKEFRCQLPSTENYAKTKFVKEESYLQNK